MASPEYDVIVVGAGVAGASLATVLARDGRRVLVIERELYDRAHPERTAGKPAAFCEPDRIIGELLQPGGCAALRRLDLQNALDGIDAQPVYGYGIFLGNSSLCLGYSSPTELNALPETHRLPPVESARASNGANVSSGATPDAAAVGNPGPAASPVSQEHAMGHRMHPDQKSSHLLAGCGFRNGRFLRRLREIASQNPNITLREGTVTSLLKDANDHVVGVSYRVAVESTPRPSDVDGGSTIASGAKKESNNEYELHTANARLTIACDGCASTLRKRANPDYSVQVYSRFIGLILRFNAKDACLPFPSHGHVVLANPAPILFYPISATEVRCLVDIPSFVTTPVTDHMLNVLAPQVPPELRAPFVAAIRAGGYKAMPNRVMPAAPAVVPGAVLLGDSFNMRHPLTGGGMTVALSDVALIRDTLRDVRDLGDEKAVQRALKQFYELRKPLSTTINILANALYCVFCATNDPALVDMREACFDYLGSGGRMSYDPMGMLGGIKPSPLLLIIHFFCVAFYGCLRVLLPFPTPSRIGKAWAIFRASFNIVKPLIDAEGVFPLNLLPIKAL